ncbi:MAG: hypothetical protein AAF850_02620 [Pseudomonadota bacterium]
MSEKHQRQAKALAKRSVANLAALAAVVTIFAANAADRSAVTLASGEAERAFPKQSR